MERVQVNMLGSGEEMEEPLIVSEWGGDVGGSVKRIYIRNFCVFCLRRLRVDKWRTRGRTRDDKEVNGVPEADLEVDTRPRLVSTLNWTWEALRRKREGDNVPVERSELEKVQRFNGIPKCCDRCGVKVLEVDSLFRKVREEVGQLRRLIGRWSEVQGRFAEFQGDLTVSGLPQGGIEETLRFVRGFHSELERNSGSTEHVNMRTDPLLLGDTEVAGVDSVLDELRELVASPHSGSQLIFEDEGDDSDYGDNGSDPDYIKSEEEDDSDDARISVSETKVLVPVPVSAPAVYQHQDKELVEIEDVKEDSSKDNSNDSDYSEDDNGSDNDSNFDTPDDDEDEDEDYIPVAKKTRQSLRSQESQPPKNTEHPSCSYSSGKLELQNKVHNSPQKKKRGPKSKPKMPGHTTAYKKLLKKKVTCDECGVTVTFACFARHQERCEKARNNPKIYKNARLPCKICGKLVIDRYLKRHMEQKHSVVFTKPFKLKDSSKVKQRCDFCKLRLPRAELLGHLEGHVGSEYVLRCPNSECLFMCITHHRLENHLRGRKGNGNDCAKKTVGSFKQYKRKLLTCEVCGVEQTNMLALRSHLLQHHEGLEKPFPCPISGCGSRFSQRQSVVVHLGQHDVAKQVETQPCSKCDDKKEIKIEEMEEHLKKEHGVLEVVKCTQCTFLFASTREELVDHMFQHRHGVLICDICEKTERVRFNRHGELVQHYFKEHQIGNKKYSCDQCPKAFFKKGSLSKHKLEHKNEKEETVTGTSKRTWKCEYCEVETKTEDGLKSHQIRLHGATPYSCSLCSDTFVSRELLRIHGVEVHKGVVKQTEFPCEEPNCGKICKTKPKLNYHYKYVHLGKKGDHVCEECGKVYRTAGGLRIHMEIVHLFIRRHVCEICGEAFAHDTVLKRHKLIHTGERPYSCDVCNQKFRQKEVLQKHLEGHQKKGADFKPNGPMKQLRARVLKKRKA